MGNNEPQMQNDKSSGDNRLYLISIALFLIFIYLLWSRYSDRVIAVSEKATGRKPSMAKEPKTDDYNRKVSHHLKMLQQKRQIELDRLKLENRTAAPAPPPRRDFSDPTAESGLSLQQERSVVLDDIREKSYKDDLKKSPKEFIYNEVDASRNPTPENVTANLTPDQQEYIREFIANARKQGYELIIDKNLVVVGYRKVNPTTGEVSTDRVNLRPPQYGR